LVVAVAVAADLVDQLRAIVDTTRIPDKEEQQIEFLGGELNGLLVYSHRTTFGVDAKGCHIDDLVSARMIVRSQLFHTAKNRLDPCGQFQHGERLCQVVVGPHLQPEHPFQLRRPGGKPDSAVPRRGSLPDARYPGRLRSPDRYTAYPTSCSHARASPR